MKDNSLFIILLLLVLTTSLNLAAGAIRNTLRTYLLHSALARQLSGGEKLNDLIAKFNERRASGILAQPRVGRTAGMVGFAHPDGIFGLVHYPRVGRSDLPSSLFTNFNQNIPPELDLVPGTSSNHYDSKSGFPIDLDYQRNQENNDGDRKRFETSNGELWSGIDARSLATRRDQSNIRSHHCDNMNRAWALIFASLRDSLELERQSAQNYHVTPTGEIDHAQQNIVS